MRTVLWLAAAAVVFSLVVAQDDGYIVWASVAFIAAADHTPILGPWRTVLTPEGAQQMLRQGQAFRTRYLLQDDDSDSVSELEQLPRARIRDMESRALDNTQLNIKAVQDDYIWSGALAFMQGLYPPAIQAFPHDVGGVNVSYSHVTEDLTQYPLGGYQYPNVKPVNLLSEDSVFVQGHIGCSAWIDDLSNVYADPENALAKNESDNFFRELFTQPLNGTLPPAQTNLWNAYDIYNLVDYEYKHNATVHNNLVLWESRNREESWNYARIEQVAKNSDLFVNSDPLARQIRPIAGRTLAAQVLNSFNAARSTTGSDGRLTLLFGSIEPIMSLASVTSMRDANSFLGETLPKPGAALVFELVTENPRVGDGIQGIAGSDYLQVRVYYREDAEYDSQFEPQRLFNSDTSSGPDFNMPWDDFEAQMTQVKVDIDDWCTECNAATSFCISRHLDEDGSGASPGSGVGTGPITPTIAGIIGAASSILVVGLGVLVAVLACGLRVHRAGRQDRRLSKLGGFKGAEKMASDIDLSISKGGLGNERVGSWELGGPAAGIVQTRDGATSNIKNVEDDGISEIGIVPVRPRESV